MHLPSPELLVAPDAILYEFLRGYVGAATCARAAPFDAFPVLGAAPQPRLRTVAGTKAMATFICLLGRRLGWYAAAAGCECGGFRVAFSDAPAGSDTVIGVCDQVAAAVPAASEPTPALVYDIETASGHFHVGPGDLVVHNTDSLYLTCPTAEFAACDADYAAARTSRAEWMAEQVRVTMRVMDSTRDSVNSFLRARSGGGYLKMAYEEVLFPVVFTGKKKYFGIPHVSEVNFTPRDMFVRGIDVIKQGQPGLAREIGYRIMWACVNLANERPVRAIVEDALRDAVVNGAQWNFEHFIKTDAWKPLKNNVAVHTFIGRMRARIAASGAPPGPAPSQLGPSIPSLYPMPEPGERFSYVIVETGEHFDLQGRKMTPSKGARMEFAAAARALGLRVDVGYYMQRYVVGLCARFINGDREFIAGATAAAADPLDDKRVDELAQRAAKAALDAFVRGLGGLDAATLRRRGVAYRRAYKKAAALAHSGLKRVLGSTAASMLASPETGHEIWTGPDAVDALWERARTQAQLSIEARPLNVPIARALGIEADGSDSGATTRSTNLYRVASQFSDGGRPARGAVAAQLSMQLFFSAFDRLEAGARGALAAALPPAVAVAHSYGAELERLVYEGRLAEHARTTELGPADSPTAAPALQSLQSGDRAAVLALRAAWSRAVGVQAARAQLREFSAHLGRLKLLRTGGASPPALKTPTGRAAIVAAAAAAIRPTGDIAI